MRCYHIKLNLVVLITCFGQTLAGHCNCDKSIDTCENIHVCYNCAFEYLAKSCQESQVSVDKETCRTHLTSGSYKRALYTKAQEECILINNNCKPEYSATVDVVFMKTCDTGCANYTMRKYENAAVAGTDNNNYTTSDYLTFCQYNCLPPTQDCTVSFASGTCTVFPTNCGGSCLLTNSTGVDVYTVTCNAVGCPTLTDPPNGAVDMSAGTSAGAQAVYSCNDGYNLTGSSDVICNLDGQWSNSAPTCTSLVGCPPLTDPSNGTVNMSAGTFPGAQAVYICKAGYNLTGSSVVICNSNGQWNNSAPTCIPLNCQPLSGPIDGFVNYTSTLVGSRAIYECNTGFVLNGSNVSTCGYDGNWDNPTPSCTPIYCGILAEPEFGSISYTETSNGTIATYNCNTGYYISEPISRSCLANGSWELPEPKCVPVDCPTLSNPLNGDVNRSAGTSPGVQAVYSCKEGYNLTGPSVVICNSDGQWSNPAPTCTPLVGCPTLSNPLNGDVNTSAGTSPGAQAVYSCKAGYNLTGSSVVICNSDGQWSNPAPTCTPLVGCPTLSNPLNGDVNTSAGTSPGAQAVYSCKEGYNLTGSSVVICNSDGQWSNPAPTCTPPVGCPTLSNPLNGVVNTSAGTSPGAQAVYSCKEGYNLTEPSVVICNSDGQWSNPTPTCTPLVGCPTLSDLPNGVVNTSAGTSPGAQAVYSCKAGYNLTGSSVVICNSDGQWSNPAPTCIPLNCQPLSGPIDGLVNYTSTLFGSRAIYECNTGFVLNGSNVSTCEYDGNWDNPTPSCTPIYCGILAEPEFGSVSYIETSNGTIATYNCDTGYNISEPISRSCLANGSWDLPEPKCVPVDCGPIPNLKNGTVDTSEGTTFGKTATFSCDEGFLLLQSSIRVCQKNSQWSGIMPSCKVPGENAKKKKLGKLFIMPCICYPNKTFEGLTEKEIIQQLIADMKIEPKDTKLAVSKLISKPDPRVSSKMIGSVAIVVLSIIGGLILCTDIMTIRARRRALEG